jgi:hypothetical protein
MMERLSLQWPLVLRPFLRLCLHRLPLRLVGTSTQSVRLFLIKCECVLRRALALMTCKRNLTILLALKLRRLARKLLK